MTDNEIMKGWDNLHDRRWVISKNGEFIRMGDVVDFINRQQAEIERLEQNLKEAHIDIKEHRAEIERLTERNFELAEKGEAVCIAYKTAKAEAIKEFAERVKRHIDVGHLRSPTEICFSELAVVNMLDNLVKEMVGDSN